LHAFLDFRFVIIKKGEIVEASFMMMNQAILMMPKAQMINSRLIQDFKIEHQESNPRFKIEEKKSRSNKSRLHIG